MADPRTSPGERRAAERGALAQGTEATSAFCRLCELSDNWIDIRYEHADGTGVAGAQFVVQVPNGGSPRGEVLAEGTLDGNGEAHVELPPGHTTVEVYYHDDPDGEPYEDPVAVQATQEPEPGFFERLWNTAGDAVTWAGGVIKGDFAEDPSTGQIITRMAITMIPGVDQVADIQDLAAALYKLIWKQEYDQVANWIALLLTLIGLVPVLGSLAKGVLKLLVRRVDDAARTAASLFRVFNYFRKGNAYRWLRQLATDLPGKHLDDALAQLTRLMTRVKAHLHDARSSWLVRTFGGGSQIEAMIVKVDIFEAQAAQGLRQAADTLATRLHTTLDNLVSDVRSATTKQDTPHTTRQGEEAPPAGRVAEDRPVRHPRTAEEYEDLARDPAKGGEITSGSIAEREVGLGLEERGEVPGPIRRDPTGGAEFVDANGQDWDVKAYRSEFPNGFRPEKIEESLKISKLTNERIMFDTRNLSASDLETLRGIIDEVGYTEGVRFWP